MLIDKASAGEYIVLLTSCDGNDCWSNIPCGYVYKLKSDYNLLHIFTETKPNGEKGDGWAGPSSYKSKMTARMATYQEMIAYERAGKPVKASECLFEDYSIY